MPRSRHIVPTVLDKIVQAKRAEIAAAKSQRPQIELQARLKDAPPVRDFFQALAGGGTIKLIAEIKKASPSKGLIRADFDPVQIGQTYQQHGASCLSILTDEEFFQGSLDNLQLVRSQVTIPVLRKDFILDSYQLIEARSAGADAALLIAECLDDCQLRKLYGEALELGLTPLVEFYEPENLERVVDLGATLIGVNNRDLRNFETDLDHTIRMKASIPDDCVLVGESGIHSRDDVLKLQRAGVDAILVGEHLMASRDIGAATDQLLGHDPSENQA